MFDDEDDTMPQSYWATPEDDAPAIDAVLNHRLLDKSSTYARSAS